jgi:NifB/MoaA-like Fe-S oxidoreductase
LAFAEELFDGPLRVCRNHCDFCFVSQMAPGLRPSLYVKDDDYRLSFLHGNYITLTNLNEADWQRIAEQYLSPLYVSVHATEPDVRVGLMHNPHSAEILHKCAV